MRKLCIGDRKLDTYSDIGNYFRADIDKRLISAGIFYLSYTFPLALFTVYCIVVVLIILMITISAFYSLQKTPLVERLRIVD